MKNTLKTFKAKEIKNASKIKGGAFGKGTRNAATSISSRPELL